MVGCLVVAAAVIVRAKALRWCDDAFPGFVEVAIVDDHGREHRIRDKTPVLAAHSITRDSRFPFELRLPARVVSNDGGEMRIRLGDGLATVDDVRELVMPASDVVRRAG